jgi:hypothetical protein
VQYVNSLCGSDSAPLDDYAGLRERHFADDPRSAAAAATLELGRGNFRRVVDDFPEQHPPRLEALCALGEFTRASEAYRGIPWMYELSEIYLNHFDQLRLPGFRALAHALRGEMDEALALAECVEALLPKRRYDEVVQYRYAKAGDHAAVLRGQGRIAEAAERGDARALCLMDVGEEALASALVLPERLYLRQHLALRSFLRGEQPDYRRHLSAANGMPCAAFWDDLWIPRYFLFPILERELGDAEACRRSARRLIDELPGHFRAKGFHLARFVLGETEIAEFEAQPVRMFMRARSILARALRAEYLGAAASAASYYREYLSLAEQDRFSDSPHGDPVVERWAAFRAQASA